MSVSVSLNLTGNRAFTWTSKESVSVKGYCFDQTGQLLYGERLALFFASVQSVNHFRDKLTEANGIFSVIIQLHDETLFAVDKTRILPLFYRKDKETLLIFDDPYTSLSKDEDINHEAKIEFLYSAITLGHKTLIDKIFQVKPSSFVRYRDGEIYEEYYYTYSTEIESAASYTELISHLDQVLCNVFQRLIASVNNRQIVIPLSGGYDSRLIASLLKRSGYNRVICYNVGRPDNPEMILSSQVAKELGLTYHFIDNSDPELISNYFQSDRFQQYAKFSGNITGTIWMYEYFGLKYLTDNLLIESDAIFVPGHSGDFLAGSQFTKAGIAKEDSIDKLINSLLLNKFHYGKAGKVQTIRKYVTTFVKSHFEENQHVLPYSVFEDFDFKEILPKYINSSCRIYEFMGHEVRLPFWDNELVEFFKTLPYAYKLNKNLYDDYLETVLFPSYQVVLQNEMKVTNRQIQRQIFKSKIKSVLPDFIVKRLSHIADHTCMKEISEPLKRELERNHIKLRFGYNEIFLKWYLMKLSHQLKMNGK
jgi:Asparagine synthase (glutamine-hydrolyzing)